MTVHHKSFERLFPGEKIISDPEQIILRLLVDRNAGTDAGMNKKIIPAAKRQFERLQKIEMFFRKTVGKLGRKPDSLVAIGIDARFKVIRQQGFETAKLPPFVQASRIGEETWQECFMITAQKDCFMSPLPLQQQVEHISRVGSSVDVVTDKDGNRTGDRTLPAIGIDCD